MKRLTTGQLLTALLVAGLALRVVLAFAVQHRLDQDPQRHFVIEGDANGYWELGEKIVRGEPYFIHQPPRYVNRMPGYPVFIASAIQLADWMGIPEQKYLVARLMSAGLGLLACVLVYVLGATLFGRQTGLVATGLCTFSPVMVGFSAILLSETLFAVTVLLSLLSLHSLYAAGDQNACAIGDASKEAGDGRPHFCGKRLTLKSVIAGICIAIACYARPSWLLVGPAWLLFLLVRWGLSRRLVLACAGLVVGIVIALMPWTVRNYGVTGHLVPLTLWVGPSLYDGLNPDATGDSDMQFFDNDRLMSRMSEYEMNKEYQRRSWEFFKSNPMQSIELGFAKLWRYWKPWPNAAQFQSIYLRIAVCLFYVPLLILSLLGAWVSRRDFALPLLLGGPLLYFAALHSIFVGSLRYRLPAEYPLYILAAWGLLTWLKSRRRNQPI